MNAFSHGDKNLFKDYPELHDALVWVYFHSNISKFNKVECWGPLKDVCAYSSGCHEEGKQGDIPVSDSTHINMSRKL